MLDIKQMQYLSQYRITIYKYNLKHYIVPYSLGLGISLRLNLIYMFSVSIYVLQAGSE